MLPRTKSPNSPSPPACPSAGLRAAHVLPSALVPARLIGYLHFEIWQDTSPPHTSGRCVEGPHFRRTTSHSSSEHLQGHAFPGTKPERAPRH